MKLGIEPEQLIYVKQSTNKGMNSQSLLAVIDTAFIEIILKTESMGYPDVLHQLYCFINRKAKKYHIVRTVLKYSRKIIERGKIDTPSTQIHDLYFSVDTQIHDL